MKKTVFLFLVAAMLFCFFSCESAEAPKNEISYDHARNFQALNWDGEVITLSDFIGKPIVLNFWASWYPPCKAELSDFQKAYEEYDEVEFVMLNLTDGSKETVDTAKSFIAQNGYTFPVYFDTTFSAAYAYSISSIPVTCFIDAEGNLVASRVGIIDYKTLVSGIKEITK